MLDQRLLEKNLSVLQDVSFSLAKRVTEQQIDESWSLVETSNGLLSACKKKGSGSDVHVSSLVDPLEEARQWAARVETGPGVFVLLGFGLGYHASLLLEKVPAFDRIIIVEASFDLFALALVCNDLASLLGNSSCMLMVGNEISGLEKRAETARDAPLHFGKFLPALECNLGYYREAEEILEELLFRRRYESETDQGLSRGVECFLNHLSL